MKRWQVRLTGLVLFLLGAGASLIYWNWLSLLAYIGAAICCLYLIAEQFRGGGPLRPGW